MFIGNAFAFFTTALISATIFVCALSGCSGEAAGTHPSDEKLAGIFWTNESDFAHLVAMSNTDSNVVRIAPEFTWLAQNVKWPRPIEELGFTTDRWDQYRGLFKKLSLKEGLTRYPESGTILLIASSEGLVTGGSSKGYAYSTKRLPVVDASLDTYTPSPSSPGRVYKQLSGPWYLFYEFE